jgi:DNA-binding LytR/AlgR family response regulator
MDFCQGVGCVPVRIIICDDDADDIALLSDTLYTYDPSFEITAFTRGETMLSEITETGLIADILFLDIYMPGVNGILTAQKARTARKDLKIVFITSSPEHYSEAYEVFAFNYILKPFDKARLYAVLDRALDELGRETVCKISFSYKSVSYSVDCRDILYIESRDKLLLFHLAGGGVQQTYMKLEELTQFLPKLSFIRCHQSFIVNISHITEMGESYFRLGPVLIGISRKYLKTAKEQYYTYLFSHMRGGLPQ